LHGVCSPGQLMQHTSEYQVRHHLSNFCVLTHLHLHHVPSHPVSLQEMHVTDDKASTMTYNHLLQFVAFVALNKGRGKGQSNGVVAVLCFASIGVV
jgi:hypothetical protein